MAEAVLQFDAASMAEDVPQPLGKRLSDVDLASRKSEEASLRRYDAIGWLRNMVGDVAGKYLPAQPSEEEFRLCLRSGIVLCNALNKVQPGAVPKVVEAPSVIVPDGAALCAFQYFENVRNFLDWIEEMGIPAFEASDLEQGGKSSRIVNCVLALKSYSQWKEGGGKGVWKFSGSSKPHSTGKHFVRKNADLFMNSLSRSSSTVEKSLDSSLIEQNFFGDLVDELHEMDDSKSLHVFIRQLLSDKKQEDIPVIVENMLGRVMEEFEHRLASQNDQAGTALKDMYAPRTDEDIEIEAGTTTRDVDVSSSNEHEAGRTSQDMDAPSSSEQVEIKDGTTSRDIYVSSPNEHVEAANIMEDKSWSENEDFHETKSKVQALKRKHLVEHHQKRIQVIKNTLHTTKEDLHKLCMKYQEEVQNLGKHLNVLASAASRYQKVLEENRKLYNQVQDLKGNIRVYCRIRPFLSGQPNGLSAAEAIDEQTLSILTHAKNGKGKKLITFNKVFGPSASQEAVFSDTQPLIRSVLDGYNVCIFAYGQTGSGKTYTMTGPQELTPESLGVNYRAISDLFFILEQRKDSISYDVSVQMIEIYNEQVRDLLVTDEVSNDSQNGINVPNTNIVPVTSTSDFNNLMDLGHKNQNSRSHCCITVYVRGRNLTSGSTTSGCMHLVDLAGSERVDKIDADGDRLNEAQHIDRSLSALGDVIYSLAQKQSRVPYRNSKLMQLLQQSLGGQAKILMFIHISPEPDALGETISTLKFAERVSTVEAGAARSGKDSADVRELKEQIASLKLALSRKERGELDVQQAEHFVNRPSWSPHGSLEPVEEETCISGDLVDSTKPPEMFQQKYNASKVHPEQPLNRISGNRRNSLENGPGRTQYESAELDDDREAETSGDSSELDYRWQTNVVKSNHIPNGEGSKAKKPTPKQTKTPEKRSQIPQAPTKRGLNGMQKQGKKPASVDGKRKPSKP